MTVLASHKKIILTFLFFNLFYIAYAQFEGVVEMIKETPTDTFQYTFYVKDNYIRVDEYDLRTGIKEYTIYNANSAQAMAVSTVKKMYTNMSSVPVSFLEQREYRIDKTQNWMNLLDYKCYQWRVVCEKQNTQVTYWMAEGDFYFFYDYMRLSNKQELISSYFQLFKDSHGFLPLFWEERSYLREFRGSYRVTSIDRKVLDISLFEVPKDFKSVNNR